MPEARLETHEIVEGGGDAARTGGIGAKREAGKALGDGDGRTELGAARNARGVEWIARHGERRADADEAGRELIEVRFANGDRAGGLQPLNDRGAPSA